MIQILAWVSLTPLLFALISANRKDAFLYGSISGLLQSVIMYGWILNVVNNFSGTENTLIAYGVFASAIVFQMLYLGVFALIFSIIVKKSKHFAILILSASVWAGMEYIKINTFGTAFPWFNYPYAVTLAKNMYFLQQTAVAGIASVSFIIVSVNILIAFALNQRTLKFIYLGIIIVCLSFTYGFTVVQYFEKNNSSDNEISIAMISGNIDAKTRWNNQTVDSLVNIYFRLNKQAIKLNPNIIVGTETAVPWSYIESDPYIYEIHKLIGNSEIWQIVGMFTETRINNKVKNSAYLINPQNIVSDRYDKMELLIGLEKPFTSKFKNSRLSFIGGSIYNNIESGINDKIFDTEFGKIGVLICNESLVSTQSREYIQQKADLLVVISNDAWFYKTQLPQHHFYATRLRAIENRLPVIVNSNRGVSGAINPSGKILFREQANDPKINFIKINILNN